MRVLTLTTESGAAERCSARVRPIGLRQAPNPSRCILLLSVLILTRCTLLGLGDIELPICDPGECDRKNRTAGISDADCMYYHCRKTSTGEVGFGVCELKIRDDDDDGYYNRVCEGQVDGSIDCDDNDNSINPSADEECDGKDNDCDRVIDEDTVFPTETPSESIDLVERYPEAEGCDKEELFELTVAGSQPSTVLGIVQKDQSWLVDTNSPDDRFPRLSYYYEGDPYENPATCPSACGSEMGCNFRQLAFDFIDTKEIITASVTDHGCLPGQLRIGFVNQNEPLVNLEGGLSNDSGVSFGVEATCSIQDQTAECNQSGVHHPVIATMRANEQQQALLVWIQESVEAPRRAECGPSKESASLQALGLWIEYPRPTVPPWLFATQHGKPLQLNQTSNIGAPSLITWRLDDSKNGFLLAYSNVQNHLEFALFPALPKDRRLKNDEDLPEWRDYPIVALGDPIEHVVVAFEKPPKSDSKRLSLLAAYRTGCDQESKIRLALFEFDTTDDTYRSALSLKSSDDLSVSTEGKTIVEGPVIAYSDSGFYLPRGSKDNTSIGGWTVVWTERRSEGYFLLSSRVSVPPDDNRIVILDEQPTELAYREGRITSPTIFSDQNGNIHFGAIDHCEGRPMWGRTDCE